ncbi:hypothetical protein MMC10_006927 [Thelotrema lepadinum]|nr:hypothetical protein [Thelotrema lepadinum]
MKASLDQDIAGVQAYYDSRAATYDESFHPQQAADYIEYVNPQTGEVWLDLACGTGLVTLLAAEAVGPEGEVIGVDISQGMLDHAITKSKTMEAALQPRFIQQDVTDLSGLAGVVSGKFDIITCCSALPMPKDIDSTLLHWVTYLKPGGRLIVDVPSTRSLINTGIFAKIAPSCGLETELPDDRRWIQSVESLKEKLELAGLKCEKVFIGCEYGSRVYKKAEMENWFERTVSVPLYEQFRTKERLETARREWLREMRSMADEQGDVHESMSFFVGIGRKPS